MEKIKPIWADLPSSCPHASTVSVGCWFSTCKSLLMLHSRTLQACNSCGTRRHGNLESIWKFLRWNDFYGVFYGLTLTTYFYYTILAKFFYCLFFSPRVFIGQNVFFFLWVLGVLIFRTQILSATVKSVSLRNSYESCSPNVILKSWSWFCESDRKTA